MIISQSRPSWAVVCTITYSPVNRVPWNWILYSPPFAPEPGFSMRSSYVPWSQIVIVPAP